MKIRWLIALLALILTAAAVLPATAQAPMKIRLGVHTSLMGAPDVIAIRQGYFKQEGLEVDWRRFALGKEGRDAMIAGAIDVNSTATTCMVTYTSLTWAPLDSRTLSATIFFRPAKPAFESTCMQIDPDPLSSALWLPT